MSAAATAASSGGIKVVSFGCRLNTLESAGMREAAGRAGLSDTILFNTCAVTEEAVRQARKAVRKARRENPSARIVVAGCAAQLDPAAFAAMPEVDAVLGNAEKTQAESFSSLPDFGVSAEEKIRVDDIMSVTETAPHLVDAIEGRARAIVEVQNGCDHRCTFCIIPFARGPARSVPAGAVVERIRRIAASGVAEVVLSGVDLTSYGSDLPGAQSLGRLVQAILAGVPDLKRLRLSSIDSVEADEALLDAMTTEERLAPYLHLSLQAGDDMILKRMKRRHSRDDAVRFCEDMRRRRPDIAFGADLIAGFPTETEAMAENTAALVEDCGLAFTHIFPFSAREGTPAARMPPVEPAVVRERAARLRALGAAALSRHLSERVGGTAEVLVERGRRGRLADFTPVAMPFGLPGTLAGARFTGHDGSALQAAPLQEMTDQHV
ncbi:MULTISPECIES: tRNA (N(6)-L-threonylcarbamoyladenosine(37)-C(2))-methylthiotransferase MtaB [unclassified Aureimonas]|uniref:tRNA (N(6)-L-threonylcarbamoyladenosine(37)-C(2))- methylthiotransferase MtaB n=1 Tax=unclassified Aureimonas TaxID=2615206 RepID=UPI0006F32E0C|nr:MULTISPECIES: tRNA (N(6)-L-threonylcarbamoyladenosine(37)-C(2))-methylthiotransferase MtaB [unclassified Aureimonas]KQT65922.1 2-methylthioadenine synthase [Aureimonas sp. Leaf427]KQT73281.1 2-methylthioadenine synthase [Aureimonas sp. Leaf460]